jgi:hypothetical protein
VLFVHAGTISRQDHPSFVTARHWSVYGELPDKIPAAKEYWVVFRCEQQAMPDLETATALAEKFANLVGDARARHFNIVGIQLDVDTPTHALPQYATFLREFRKRLPKDCRLSITALLDWFRSGTAIADVISQVDEFVPQFYDIDRKVFFGEPTIAAKIDAVRWGPIFNRFGKRFRVGVSTFGRARFVPKRVVGASSNQAMVAFGDVVPLDIATNPAFRLETGGTDSRELVLTYRATRKFRLSYKEFEAGDAIQFILPTPEAVRAAVESVRQMKGNVAGVVFFRLPSDGEALTMQPGEVLNAAGAGQGKREARSRIDMVDGRCAAVKCVDIYMEGAEPYSPELLRYRIHSSAELEYFLPEKNVPVRMTNPSELELSLPPYCARGRLYLGRAVSAVHSDFEIEAAR